MELTRALKPGFYAVELNKTVWIIPNYYQNLTPVGTGAYGTVWSVCYFIGYHPYPINFVLFEWTEDCSLSTS